MWTFLKKQSLVEVGVGTFLAQLRAQVYTFDHHTACKTLSEKVINLWFLDNVRYVIVVSFWFTNTVGLLRTYLLSFLLQFRKVKVHYLALIDLIYAASHQVRYLIVQLRESWSENVTWAAGVLLEILFTSQNVLFLYDWAWWLVLLVVGDLFHVFS